MHSQKSRASSTAPWLGSLMTAFLSLGCKVSPPNYNPLLGRALGNGKDTLLLVYSTWLRLCSPGQGQPQFYFLLQLRPPNACPNASGNCVRILGTGWYRRRVFALVSFLTLWWKHRDKKECEGRALCSLLFKVTIAHCGSQAGAWDSWSPGIQSRVEEKSADLFTSLLQLGWVSPLRASSEPRLRQWVAHPGLGPRHQ